jgi:hypothetical protein
LPSQQLYQSNDSDLMDAMHVLDHVRVGNISVPNARKLLAGLTSMQRDRLTSEVLKRHSSDGGDPPNNELEALLPEQRAKQIEAILGTKGKPGRGFLGNITHAVGEGLHPVTKELGALGGDIQSSIYGLGPGLYLAGKSAGSDYWTGLQGLLHPGQPIPPSELMKNVVNPAGKQMDWQYGPLVQGKPGEFAHRLGQHPLGPILDALSVASAGVGTVGRVGEIGRIGELGKIEELASGEARVGNRLRVMQDNQGRWHVYDPQSKGLGTHPVFGQDVSGAHPLLGTPEQGAQKAFIGGNFPDKASAIAHAQSLMTGGITGSNWDLARKAFMRAGPKGNLVNTYEKALNINHTDEVAQIAKEISGVLDPNTQIVKRLTARQTIQKVAADLRATRERGQQMPTIYGKNLPGFIGPHAGKTASVAATTLREAMDMVRAGAIYLRGAYLPNNWAGNFFMNSVHQGVFAPVNLAKSFVMDKQLGTRYTRAVDRSMGMNPSEALLSGQGKGYIASVTSPVAHSMGMIADQPFRRAAFLHEARRAGFRNLNDVKGLIDEAATGNEGALMKMSDIARNAQEEIGKFGHMNETERQVLRNMVFVYSWMRAAGKYSARFPFAHPIQTAVDNMVAQHGSDWAKQQMGGVPSFLVGSIPVGHDKDGNPLLVNPFSLNPLGTGLQMGQAAAGTAQVIGGSKKFNKYASQDVVSLLNPIAQSYIERRGGGKQMLTQLEQTQAWYRLQHELQHPGSGSIYPGTKAEAIGHFMGGGLYPRQADQTAIERALEREQRGNPEALIPSQVKAFEKATGTKIPPQLIGSYKADLEMVNHLKDFQDSYASQHGTSGFRNMPPANKLQAAIEFLRQYSHLPTDQILEIQREASQAKTDAEMTSLANGIFAMTGIGTYKRAWQQMMSQAHGLQATRMR